MTRSIKKNKVLEAVSESKQHKSPAVVKSRSGIVVEGIHDVAVRFSKCCSPVPGDEILGFVTRGRGVSIHRTDCVNIMNLPEADRARIIDAEWYQGTIKAEKDLYMAEIKIYANNRSGILVDISKVFTENQIDVQSMTVRTSKQGTATISVGFEIHGVEQLHMLVGKLRNVESVIDIERASS